MPKRLTRKSTASLAKRIARLRLDYSQAKLDESEINPNPFGQFEHWFKQALKTGMYEPNAMALATVGASKRPSLRMVLLKHFDRQGFVFFTNQLSRKGLEIAGNPEVSLLFYWPELERQVRIEGRARKLSSDIARSYFKSRPKGAQIAASVSPQSQVVIGRQYLEKMFVDFEMKFGPQKIPCPKNWGGYLVVPNCFEFWQGRSNRLHDRLRYQLISSKRWKLERLAP